MNEKTLHLDKKYRSRRWIESKPNENIWHSTPFIFIFTAHRISRSFY